MYRVFWGLSPEEAETPIERAYRIIVKTPHRLLEWEKASLVLDNFSVKKLGEEHAFEFLVEVICLTHFPESVRGKYGGRAEGYLEELLLLSGDHELHDEVAVIRRMILEGEALNDTRNAYRKIPA